MYRDTIIHPSQKDNLPYSIHCLCGPCRWERSRPCADPSRPQDYAFHFNQGRLSVGYSYLWSKERHTVSWIERRTPLPRSEFELSLRWSATTPGYLARFDSDPAFLARHVDMLLECAHWPPV